MTGGLQFEWDEYKAERNREKHGVSFDDAKTVFGDARSLTIYDEAHSVDEDRCIDIGMAASGRLLVVVYTERNERIRIISSRLAERREQQQYEEQ
jgi:uncharacterized protein